VAAAVAVFATALLMPRLRRRAVPLLPYAGMALLVVLMFTKVGSQVIHQLRFGGDSSASGSDLQRGQDARLAYTQIGARPFAGVGFSVIQDAHDIYLQVLAAGGVVALAAFLVYLGGLAGAARRAWAVAPREEVVAVCVTIGIWLVNGVFDDQLADKYLYVMPGLLLGLSRLGVAAAARGKARPGIVPASAVAAPAAAGYPAARSPAPASRAAAMHSTR
jgi:O-antigen ligase